MPLEPNQNMDDLLKAYAKERREQAGAPLELHSADRKALQDEVARKFGQADRTRWSLLAGLWPRLALAGIVAVAGTMLLVWHGGFKTPKATEFAKQDVARPAVLPQGRMQPEGAEKPAPREALNSPMQPTPNPTVTGGLSSQREALTSPGAPVTKQEEKSLGWQDNSAVDTLALSDKKSRALSEKTLDGVPQKLERRDLGEVLASRDAAKAMPETKEKRDDTRVGMAAVARQRGNRGGGGGGGGIALTEMPQTTGSLSGSSVSVSPASRPPEADLQMRFQQIDNRAKYRQNLLSPPVPKVLVSFELQRNGQNVRIVDADGSVYEGKVVQAAGNSLYSNNKAYWNNQYSTNQLRASDADALSNSSGYLGATLQSSNAQSPFQNEQSFSFYVKGYNKAIKQGIAFTGSYIPDASSFSNNTVLEKNVTSNLGGARNVTQQQPLQNSVISGRVEVGTVTEFPLDANSLPPTGTQQQR